ncbi:cytochrome P450 [Streptomyces sp. NPDC002547]
MGDVVRAPWGGYFVTGFEACSQVLRSRAWLSPDIAWRDPQPDLESCHAPVTREEGRTLSRLNAQAHARQGRSPGNLFDRRVKEEMQSDIAGHVRQLLDSLEESLNTRGEADIVTTVSERLPIHTVGQWLKIDDEHYSHIQDLSHRQVYAQELLPTKSDLATAACATSEMRTFFTDLIRQRRVGLGNDVLSGWIRYWDALLHDDPIGADRVLSHLIISLTIASVETTATLLSVAIWLLLRDPGRWDWLCRHPEHVDGVIDETLRYDPPIYLDSRIAGCDTQLAGVPIAKDTKVHVLYGAANHDPRRYENPHVFDILRRGGQVMFGAGAHYCLGAALGRLEAQTLLTHMLKRFPTLKLANGPTYAPRLVFRRVTSLKVMT